MSRLILYALAFFIDETKRRKTVNEIHGKFKNNSYSRIVNQTDQYVIIW